LEFGESSQNWTSPTVCGVDGKIFWPKPSTEIELLAAPAKSPPSLPQNVPG